MFRKSWFETFSKVTVAEKHNEIDLVMYMHGQKTHEDNLAFGLHVVLDLFNQDNTFPSEWPSFKENKAKWDITESLLAKST